MLQARDGFSKDATMEKWYTLYTKPNAEHQVVKALTQRQIHTYLPEIELPKTRKGRKPFFPCYLFARVDLSQVGISSLQWTPGLRRVVGFGDQPTPLPDEVIKLIQDGLNEIEAAGGWTVHNFKPGDTVLITSGPFQDMLAIFAGPTTAARRVQVLLNILGHASRVQVEVDDLAKASVKEEVPPLKRPRGTRGHGRKIKYNRQLNEL
jgi:transcriptional antiterminator RfaH